MSVMAQPWPPGTEPGQPDAELGTVKASGGEAARVWPKGPPGADWYQPPVGGAEPPEPPEQPGSPEQPGPADADVPDLTLAETTAETSDANAGT